MNNLLGISRNDIIKLNLATIDEVKNYENGRGPEPSLEPMRPYFDGKLLVEWNLKLCELFIPHFAEKRGCELTDYVWGTLEMAFERCLQQIEQMNRATRKQQRASTRRDKVSHITPQNLTLQV